MCSRCGVFLCNHHGLSNQVLSTLLSHIECLFNINIIGRLTNMCTREATRIQCIRQCCR